jgi:L-2-hydroxycarboxylate dehydrogenase (NAD+)
MKINLDELVDLCKKVMKKSGMDDKTIELVLEEYLDGELRGTDSHGIALIKKFGVGKVESEPWVIETDEENYMLVDGKTNYGQVVLDEIFPKLLEKTKKHKIAMLGIHNMTSYSRPGTYARKAAEAGLIGIITNYSGRPRVAPFGTIDPILGTNPIAFGIPGDPDIVLDMATSKRNFAKVRVSQRLGNDLPEGMAMDKNGVPTIDPEKAMEGALYPFGGYKGSGLCLVLDILTRCMFNIKWEPGKVARGFFFILIDPTAFGDLEVFRRNVAELEQEIKTARKSGEVEIPGERGEARKEKILEQGWIEIDDKIIEELRAML